MHNTWTLDFVCFRCTVSRTAKSINPKS